MTVLSAAPLNVGERAPDFTLVDQTGTPITLSTVLSQRAVALVFYPFAFSGICTGELTEIRDDLGAFDTADVHVMAVSCDPMYSLRAWADQQAYFFPLLSDFWPHGETARSYGVFHDKGFAVRGTFLIGRDATLLWAEVDQPGQRRDFTALRAQIAALTQG